MRSISSSCSLYEERKRLNDEVLNGLEPDLFQPASDAQATATAREMVRVLDALAANLAAEQQELAHQDFVLFRELLSPVQVRETPSLLGMGITLLFSGRDVHYFPLLKHLAMPVYQIAPCMHYQDFCYCTSYWTPCWRAAPHHRQGLTSTLCLGLYTNHCLQICMQADLHASPTQAYNLGRCEKNTADGAWCARGCSRGYWWQAATRTTVTPWPS